METVIQMYALVLEHTHYYKETRMAQMVRESSKKYVSNIFLSYKK